MIRTAQPPRMGGSDCPWYSPFCWFVPATDNSDACAQAAGGSTTSALYQRCMAQIAADEQGMAASQPGAAQDYQSAKTGNVLDLINPFAGTGPFSKDNPNPPGGIPGWIWLAGAGALGLVALGGLRR